jgi:hypothetical protein
LYEFLQLAQHMCIPLKMISPIEPGISQLYQKQLTIIRPDQHIAWQGDDVPKNPQVLLKHITGQQ